MRILVFTEGTVLMHKSAQGLSREEVVEQSRKAGIQREEAVLQYESKSGISVEPYSVYDHKNYIPVGNSVEKLTNWKNQEAIIYYLSSRRIKPEIEAIKSVLKKYNFPDSDNLYFRQQEENYKNVAERIMPDVLIEDDCESIGGEKKMIYTHLKPEIKDKIKSVVVKEFAGIDALHNNITELVNLT